MGIIEILLAVAAGVATLFGFLLKREVKKNGALEVEAEAGKRIARTAIQQQSAVILSEEEEEQHVEDMINKTKKEVEDEKNGKVSGKRLHDFINLLHDQNDKN